jgi:hypothetical protein
MGKSPRNGLSFMTTISKIGGLGRLKNQGTPAIVNTQIVFIYLACDIKEK